MNLESLYRNQIHCPKPNTNDSNRGRKLEIRIIPNKSNLPGFTAKIHVHTQVHLPPGLTQTWRNNGAFSVCINVFL